MNLAILSLVLSAVAVLIGVLILFRLRQDGADRMLDAMRHELRTGRTEAADLARAQREELQHSLHGMTRALQEAQDRLRQETQDQARASREELAKAIRELQQGNEKKLEEMRHTVDEKLQGTLEKRLGESFELVSKRLEAVHQGLGEMQQLATGVGDLKRALGNVKTLGIFGELQLRALLEQLLAPDQYVVDYRPREDSTERVEFAIVLPGQDSADGRVHLPVDSKFPQEDYLRLLDAADQAEPEAVKAARASLVRAVKQYARDVSAKYIHVPRTTDFAIVFLPTEGLYAEVLRHPGLLEELQREYRVTLAGPTTLAAYLTALRMGFRTLAIQQRSHEVWEVLGAVKAEFGKFGGTLDKVKHQLARASATLDHTTVRTRAMERKLREVQELPAAEAGRLLGIEGGDEEVVVEEAEGGTAQD